MRTNWLVWSGVHRRGYPTLVIDLELRSWALPFAIHAGGPLLGKFGFHLRVLCLNIGWSKL